MSTIYVFFWDFIQRKRVFSGQPLGRILQGQSDQEDGTGKLSRNVGKNRNTKGKGKVIPLQAQCGPEVW